MTLISSPSTEVRAHSPLDQILANPRYQFGVVVFLAVVVMFSKLSGLGLANYDDCFYAQKGKEIWQTGSWMTMHYAGGPAIENPPFFIWLVALSYKLWGVNEYAAIFPSALLGLGAVVLVYFFARILFDAWVAFLSSFVLTTTFIFTKYARHAMMDVSLSFFVLLALLSLWLALKKNPRYFLLWGVSISVCILIKSVLGFFPAVITVLFLLMTKRWSVFITRDFLLGVAIILMLGCSWYVHQWIVIGEPFVQGHFGWVILERGYGLPSQSWHEHLSYFQDLLKYYWPWLPVFGFGCYKLAILAVKRNEIALLILLWIVSYLAIMSTTQSRMLWYVMPIFPAAAVVCGYMLGSTIPAARRGRVVKGVCVFALAAGVVLSATPVKISAEREADVRTIAPYVRHFVERQAKVIGFRYTFYSINNALLFYSDHAARTLYYTFDDLSAALADSATVLCVLPKEDVDSVLTTMPNTRIVRRTSGASLIANRALDISEVETR